MRALEGRWARALALLAAAAAAAALVIGGPLAQAATMAAAERGVHDGESLLRGLFFGQGPVARQHPELALNRVEGAGARVRADRLVADVRRQDAGFLARVAAGVRSGDRVRVRAVLAEAADLLGQAQAAADGAASLAMPDRRPTVLDTASVMESAAVQQTSRVVHSYVIDAAAVGSSSLRLELLVNEIAGALRA